MKYVIVACLIGATAGAGIEHLFMTLDTRERVIHRSVHRYTVPPGVGEITVEIKSMGYGGGRDQTCYTIEGEKGANGGGDGGAGVFCGDSVAILPGHGGQ